MSLHTRGAHFGTLIDDAFGLTSGLSPRSNERSSSRVNGAQFLDFSTQRATRRQSPPGGRTSTGFFSCLMCVPSSFSRLLLNIHSKAEVAINTHVTVVNTLTVVSDMRRDMPKREEGGDGQNRTVSYTHALHVTGWTLITAQTQNRSAIQIINESMSHI